MNTKMTKNLAMLLTSRVTIVFSVLTVLIISANAASAYGPERPTYTTQNAAPHITFNSITNNEAYGDERDFLTIKDASITTSGDWKNNIQVEDGKEYLVRVLVHNNAKAQLNLVANNTRIAVNVPFEESNSITIDGFVRSDDATPKEIWDDVVMTNDKMFNITYVTGSAKYYNNIKPKAGFTLSDNIVNSTGALVGYQTMDGKVQGCYEYSGYAIFKVKVATSSPDFVIEKTVRPHGKNKWSESISAKPGQKVDYQIYYDNTGDANQLDVVALDKLPKGVKIVPGSTTLKNIANPNGDGLPITNDKVVAASGLNIGSYAPNSNAYLRFTAILPKASKLECGTNELVNLGTISTQNGDKDDKATVVITKECVGELPTTGPVEVAIGLTGVAAITFGVVYYFKSRRDLDKAVIDAHTQSTVGKAPIEPPVQNTEPIVQINEDHKE